MPTERSIRAEYETHGASAYYQQFGPAYQNPHEPAMVRCLETAVRTWPLDLSNVLDLACGSGEVSLALRELGATAVHGIDPFTADAYLRRTGQVAERFTFAQIAAGALAGRSYSLIACSFALHLEELSRLPRLMFQLQQISDSLLILTPHKRPQIPPAWGWTLKGEFVAARVRTRWYRSDGALDSD